jgi:hypothetical protein
MAELKTRAPKANEGAGREIVVEYNFGADITEMSELFTAEKVAAAAKAQFTIDLQAIIRGMMEDGKTDDEIKTKVAEWKPGLKVARTPKTAEKLTVDSVLGMFEKMTPEEKANFIQSLKSKAAPVTA